jgi:hypothetical protein
MRERKMLLKLTIIPANIEQQMTESHLLIINYDDSSHVICTENDLDTFHRYMEACAAETWLEVMRIIGKQHFLQLWRDYNSEHKLTDGATVLFEPDQQSYDEDTLDLKELNTWKNEEGSPLADFAFSALVDSKPIADSLIKKLGGHMVFMISGTYYDKDPNELQEILKQHGFSASIIADIPHEQY